MSTDLQAVSEQPSKLPTLPEQLTQQFYDWERRGRGWRVWNQPVELEPPFRPFFHYWPTVEPIHDDGRRETWLSKLTRNLFGPGETKTPERELPEIEEYLPTGTEAVQPLIEVQVTLPPDLKISKTIAEHLLLNLSYCRGPISFEVIGTSDEIVVQFVCQEPDRAQLVQQLKAHFPDGMVVEEHDYLRNHWAATRESMLWGLAKRLVPVELERL